MRIIVKMICCLMITVWAHASTEDISKNYVERLQEIERESYKAIDEIFMNIRAAAVYKEKREWFKELKANELQYLLTEAHIYSFDTMTPFAMPEKVTAYLKRKIPSEMRLAFVQGIDSEGMEQFVSISQMMCELSDGIDCAAIICAAQEENKQIIDELKKQREAQRRAEFLARENILAQQKETD